MRQFVILLPLLFLGGRMALLHAETVRVLGVEGLVLYGAGRQTPTQPLHAGEALSAGTFSSSGNGILYLSTFEGSELRLSESGGLYFEGVGQPCAMGKPGARRSTFRLLQGKIQITIRETTSLGHCYHIVMPWDSLSIKTGQCVICMHGEGTYVFVAKGKTELESREVVSSAAPTSRFLPEGQAPSSVQAVPPVVVEKAISLLKADGNVVVLDRAGDVQVRPLSSFSSATQNCLLAGLHAGVESGNFSHAAHVDASIVSPIQ